MVKMMKGGHAALLRILMLFVAACGGVEEGEIETGETASSILLTPNCNLQQAPVGPVQATYVAHLSSCSFGQTGPCYMARCEYYNGPVPGRFIISGGPSIETYITMGVYGGLALNMTASAAVTCEMKNGSGSLIGTCAPGFTLVPPGVVTMEIKRGYNPNPPNELLVSLSKQ